MKQKRILLLLVMMFTMFFAYGQDTDAKIEKAEALCKEGVALHDQGKYEEAIKKYDEALKDKHKTVIFSSHIISSLTDISDEIFYIHAGKLMNSFNGDVSAEEIEKIIAEKVL